MCWRVVHPLFRWVHHPLSKIGAKFYVFFLGVKFNLFCKSVLDLTYLADRVVHLQEGGAP